MKSKENRFLRKKGKEKGIWFRRKKGKEFNCHPKN